MAFQDYLTVEGERMLAKATAGYKIRFTKLVMGSGEIANGISEKDVKEVIAPEHTVDIGGVFLNGNDSVLVAAVFTNAEITEGFYFREKALYISDGTEEVLAIYGNSREQAEYIDTASFTVIEKRIRSIIKLTQAELGSIILSSAICAVAPIVTEKTRDDFIRTAKADIIEVGQVLIADRKVYTYIGDDPHDKDSYYSCSGWMDEIDLDAIRKAFEEVFSSHGYWEPGGFNVAVPFYHVFSFLSGTAGDYGTVRMGEYDNAYKIAAGFYTAFSYAPGSVHDHSSGTVAYIQNEYDIKPAFDYVFGRSIVEKFMSLTESEIDEATGTPWDGAASKEPYALTEEEINEATGTPWDGGASRDPFALTAEEIEEVLG